MVAREKLNQLKARFGPAIQRADLPADDRLYLLVEPTAMSDICQCLFQEPQARYIVGIGADDRPHSGSFLVAHNFAYDADHLLGSVMTYLPADHPALPSIAQHVPAANWSEREFRDLVGIEPVGHPFPKRLILPDRKSVV